jgi:hypothetical protein
MSLDAAGVLAGMMSTTLFVVSYLPMLVKAMRSKDLSSYSPGNLLLANVGNIVHSVYVFSLPFGPIWFLHTFYALSSALMLWWWWRYHWARSRRRQHRGVEPSALALQDGDAVAGHLLAVEHHAPGAQPVDQDGPHGGGRREYACASG